MTKKYNVWLTGGNSIAPFDTGYFDSVDELLGWVAGRGGKYLVQIDDDRGNDLILSAHDHGKTTTWQCQVFSRQWKPVTADDIKRLIG